MTNLPQLRVVVMPTKDKNWSWVLQHYRFEYGVATWYQARSYINTRELWGISETKEEAFEAGQKAAEELKEEYNKVINFKKYQQQNTFIKEVKWNE